MEIIQSVGGMYSKIAHIQLHRANRSDISSWILEGLPSEAWVHSWCKLPARANGRLVPQHLQHNSDTYNILDVTLKVNRQDQHIYLFIEVYIGANEIHVDLKQCMKLDVLNVYS